MTDEHWFVLRKDRGRSHMTPVSGKGWAAVVVYALLTVIPLPLMILFVEETPWVAVPHLLWVGLLTWGFLRFARSRAEVIDLRQESADWREFKAWQEERRRRGRG